jgi:hypothetical protein
MDGSGNGVDTDDESRLFEGQDQAHLFRRGEAAIVKTVNPRIAVVFDLAKKSHDSMA